MKWRRDFLPFLVSNRYLNIVPKDPTNDGSGDVLYDGSGYSYAYICYPNSWPDDRKNSLSLGAKLETGEVYWLVRNEETYTCK